jgi:hypothetical protein
MINNCDKYADDGKCIECDSLYSVVGAAALACSNSVKGCKYYSTSTVC